MGTIETELKSSLTSLHISPDTINDVIPTCLNTFDKQVTVARLTDQMRELQTNIRDVETSRGDFIFCADRLIRMVVEEALGKLPYDEVTVTTPTGATYEGKKFKKGVICGVSIMRSGEAMEQGLRDCCRSIRIGKILIQTDQETEEAKVFYAKFPSDIRDRQVLLLYPIMSSGNTVSRALEVLREHGVHVDNILLVTLFCTPNSLRLVTEAYPQLRILTSEIHPVAPSHFGQKYFGMLTEVTAEQGHLLELLSLHRLVRLALDICRHHCNDVEVNN